MRQTELKEAVEMFNYRIDIQHTTRTPRDNEWY